MSQISAMIMKNPVKRLQRLSKIFCWLSFAIASSILFMWAIGDRSDKISLVSCMKFSTALGLFFASTSFLIYLNIPDKKKWWPVINGLAVLTSLLGVLTLVDYILGINFALDHFGLTESSKVHPPLAARPTAPNAAFCLTVLGVLLYFHSFKSWLKFAQALAVLLIVLSVVNLISYLFEAHQLYQFAQYIRISPYTAVCLLLLAFSVLLSRPETGLIRILIRRTASGLFARRLMLAALIAPPLIGWLCLVGQEKGIISDSTSSALVATGTILLFVGLVWRIAETIESSEDEARINQARFKTIAEAIPTLVWTSSADGNVTYYNRQWYAYTGLNKNESEGWAWRQVIHPDDVEETLQCWLESLKKGVSLEREHRIRRAEDGEFRWHLVRAIPLFDDDNNITEWFGTLTDIHEQKLAAESLLQSKEIAEKANFAKTQLLANMSHEIRTPIGAIIGFTELMKNPLSTESEKQNFMQIIEKNSQNLLRLIDDILDLSKVEAGKIAIEKANFKLTHFLADFSSVMALKAEDKGIKFVLRFEGQLPEQISSDQLRLRQVLSNVVGNAIKFTESGSVEMCVKFVAPSLIFTVADTGPGISQENMDKLFQAFGQVDPSLTRKYGGTGLGLLLSRRLSRALGGDLILQKSQLGVGSTFRVHIEPRVSPNAIFVNIDKLAFDTGGLPFTDEKKGALAGLKVLLIEDSPDNRTLVGLYLQNTGALIEVANDGLEGYKKALEYNPDVILMDIQMPVLDGHGATRELRGKGFLKPIIALTAHAMREERDKCFESGCTDYLTKPIGRSQLIEILTRYRIRKTHRPQGSSLSAAL